jgi:oligoendopeptidase F
MENEKEKIIDKLEILLAQKSKRENEVVKKLNRNSVEKIDKILENQGIIKKPEKGLTSLIKKHF